MQTHALGKYYSLNKSKCHLMTRNSNKWCPTYHSRCHLHEKWLWRLKYPTWWPHGFSDHSIIQIQLNWQLRAAQPNTVKCLYHKVDWGQVLECATTLDWAPTAKVIPSTMLLHFKAIIIELNLILTPTNGHVITNNDMMLKGWQTGLTKEVRSLSGSYDSSLPYEKYTFHSR